MKFKLPFTLYVAASILRSCTCDPVNVLFLNNGQSLKLAEHQNIRVQETTASCSTENKGLLRMANLHLEFCNGRAWVRLSEEMVTGKNCQDIKRRGQSRGDGVYWLDPDGGSHSNAFLAYCDMTSYNGGWTMCYTTDEYAKPKTEITYNPSLPYGTDGYRSNCNNVPFTEIIFTDHQTGNKAYFKRKSNLPTIAAANYGKSGSAYGLWNGVGSMNSAYSYQLLICDHSFYTGFFVSGYTNCYKRCNHWCGDKRSPYFRTASTSSNSNGVAFNTNGHYPNKLKNRLISVGLR